MDSAQHTQRVIFIWGIADDVLRDVNVKGTYRDVIPPMVVIRRLDSVLEPAKAKVRETHKRLGELPLQRETDGLLIAIVGA